MRLAAIFVCALLSAMVVRAANAEDAPAAAVPHREGDRPTAAVQGAEGDRLTVAGAGTEGDQGTAAGPDSGGEDVLGAAAADRQPPHRAKRRREVVVEDPYLDLHSGPGRGYPVFYIAERGEHVAVLKRRTDWFKVRVPRGEEGWVPLEQLERTLDPDGKPFRMPGFELGDYTHRRWEVGAMYGDFGGANLIAAYGAFSVTENIAVEAWASQALGRYSDSKLLSLDVVETFYPEKRFSPYFSLGGGIVTTQPKATLVATTDRRDRAAHAGLGLRAYLARRFVFRAEFKTYVIFTSRNDNEEIREWQAGFSFFL